jgi:hypothetical protein
MLIDLAAGGTPVYLASSYTLSAQAKLVLTAHEVYLPKPKLAVEGSGGVQASFVAAGRMLTATPSNDLDVPVTHDAQLFPHACPQFGGCSPMIGLES